MKRVTFAILGLLLVFTSCAPTPRLVEHPQPDLKVVPLSYEGEVCDGYLSCPSMLPDWLNRESATLEKAGDGYVVHLFGWFICHCGPFYINTVDINVHKDGTLSIAEPQPGFRDPAMDGNRVD